VRRVAPASEQQAFGHAECPEFCRTLQDPSGSPLSGLHSHTMPSMPPLASTLASGDHASASTQFLWPCASRAEC